MLFISILIALTACSSNQNIVMNGWIDDDTYRISGEGYAPPRETELSIKKEQACEAAKIDATIKALDKFAQSGAKTIKWKKKYDTKKNIKSGSGVIKRPYVYATAFDEESNKCIVIIEIKEKDLKKKYYMDVEY